MKIYMLLIYRSYSKLEDRNLFNSKQFVWGKFRERNLSSLSLNILVVKLQYYNLLHCVTTEIFVSDALQSPSIASNIIIFIFSFYSIINAYTKIPNLQINISFGMEGSIYLEMLFVSKASNTLSIMDIFIIWIRSTLLKLLVILFGKYQYVGAIFIFLF